MKAVVTFTEELALEQAVAADRLLTKGVYLGDLSLSHLRSPVHLMANYQTGVTLLLYRSLIAVAGLKL